MKPVACFLVLADQCFEVVEFSAQNMHTLSFLRFDMRYYFVAVVASEPSNVLDSNTGREGLRVGEIDVKRIVVAAIEELPFHADVVFVLIRMFMNRLLVVPYDTA